MIVKSNLATSHECTKILVPRLSVKKIRVWELCFVLFIGFFKSLHEIISKIEFIICNLTLPSSGILRSSESE